MAEDEPPSTCYFSPKLEVRPNPAKGGYGIFTRVPIPAGELLLIMGGKIINQEQLNQVEHTFSIQVEEDAYICPLQDEKAYRINHACDPTAGVVGQMTFVALRDLAADEEICYDYAMTDGGPYDEFTCHCNTPLCRHQVSGNDWQRPELWERYAGHFSPYLQRRIDLLRTQTQLTLQVNGQ